MNKIILLIIGVILLTPVVFLRSTIGVPPDLLGEENRILVSLFLLNTRQNKMRTGEFVA